LLVSQWKSGKTTLLALLLARRATGGTLAERDVVPGRTVVVSEKDLSLWQKRRARLDFGDRLALRGIRATRAGPRVPRGTPRRTSQRGSPAGGSST
jgi:hypothetical protein